MFETSVNCPSEHWPLTTQIRIFASRSHVCSPLLMGSIYLATEIIDTILVQNYLMSTRDASLLLKRQSATPLEPTRSLLNLTTLIYSLRSVQLALSCQRYGIWELTDSVQLRVLQQLTQWVMLHPDRVREKMDEQKPTDQTEWVCLQSPQ